MTRTSASDFRMPALSKSVAGFVFGALSSLSSHALADNPIIQNIYTADPAPMIHEGRLYLYTTHDEDVTVDGFFTMNDWRVYSTTDVVNWTDHGSPLHYNDFSWARGNAWAPQVIHRNGTFYFYVPVVQHNGGNAIGVATADNPLGPFRDAVGRPLVTSDCGDIDPSVFIDDDGQAYLYWGNPNLCYVLLNEDMISYRGGVVRVPMTTASFGVRADSERPTSYEEGPWFYKRQDLYYVVYPGGPLPEHIAHSTSTSPTGPWTYRGVIMPAEGGSFTNHPGVVDYGGKSLFFYHNAALPGGGGFKRSVCVEEFTYNADGSIPQLRMTREGASAVATLNPFVRVEAETIAWQEGIETEVCSEGGMNVTSIDAGDYIKVKEVEFGSGATGFSVRVAAASGGGQIELRLGSNDGQRIGTCAIAATGGANTWATQECEIDGATGKHDLFLRFTSGGFKFDWWSFSGPGADDGMESEEPTDGEPMGEGGAGGAGGAGDPAPEPSGTAGQAGVGGTPGVPVTDPAPSGSAGSVPSSAPTNVPTPAPTVPPTSGTAPQGSGAPSPSATNSAAPMPSNVPPAPSDTGTGGAPTVVESSPSSGSKSSGCRLVGGRSLGSNASLAVVGLLLGLVFVRRSRAVRGLRTR